jgi:peptide/nickel transport system substrate-binding protein
MRALRFVALTLLLGCAPVYSAARPPSAGGWTRTVAALGGVRVRIRQLELGAFLAGAQSPSREYDALVTGIPGDLSLGYLGALFDSRRRGEAQQYAQYANPAVDAALDAGDLAAVQRLVAADAPVTWLYHARGVQGVSRRLHGVRMDLRGELATVRRWRLGLAP